MKITLSFHYIIVWPLLWCGGLCILRIEICYWIKRIRIPRFFSGLWQKKARLMLPFTEIKQISFSERWTTSEIILLPYSFMPFPSRSLYFPSHSFITGTWAIIGLWRLARGGQTDPVEPVRSERLQCMLPSATFAIQAVIIEIWPRVLLTPIIVPLSDYSKELKESLITPKVFGSILFCNVTLVEAIPQIKRS